ncbi:MAG: protein phosphatase 2C domain-containing protein [Chloroflexi bacterium]|nr:protein phosphatase 2C domain-containing protein [Chloroflexota bacterium]MCC6891267.1 serine/threonine-protein phosphatase [Anaerolineae bacterium]
MDLFRRLFSQANTKTDSPTPIETKPPTEVVEKKPETVMTNPLSTQPVEIPSMPNIADGITRPLPPETVISSSNEHLLFGQATDVGMVRTNNQDAVFSFVSTSRSATQRPDFGLFVVADGMGGHHDGEKASAITANMVAAYITNHIFLPMLNSDDETERVPITESMIAAVQKANADIITKVPDGGTTLTAVAVIGDLAYIAHVGDSRIYLITKDHIEQITRDHSLVQRYVELNLLTPEEASVHAQKNVLYRALGQSETLEVDALTRRLPPNSKLILCSDGLWNLVTEDEIAEIVSTHSNPQEACDKLVALANTHGGTDNITVIMLKIPAH